MFLSSLVSAARTALERSEAATAAAKEAMEAADLAGVHAKAALKAALAALELEHSLLTDNNNKEVLAWARTVHDASYDQANQDSNEEDQRVMMVSASDPSDQESNDVPTENPSSLAHHSIFSDIHIDSGKWRPSTNDVEFIQEDYFDDAGDHNYHIVEPMFEHGEDSDEDDDEDYIYPGYDHQSSLLRKIRRGKKEKGRGSPKRFKNCGVCAPCVSMASFKRYYFIIKYS